jgi:hypothetical protein
MLAPGGEHLAHLLAWALQNRMTIEQMLEMPYYHPVLEEALRTALRDANARLRAARRARSEPALDRAERTHPALTAYNPDYQSAAESRRIE